MSKIDVTSLIKEDLADKLLDYAARMMNYEEARDFQNTFKATIEEYDHSPYAFLSTGIFLDKLESFKEWLPDLLVNKNKIIPLLVSNMLRGDMFAASVYRGICEALGKQDLIITYDDLHRDEGLRAKFNANGAAEPALVKITAERWLMSEQAADILMNDHLGQQTLCVANQILGLHNDYANCGEV